MCVKGKKIPASCPAWEGGMVEESSTYANISTWCSQNLVKSLTLVALR